MDSRTLQTLITLTALTLVLAPVAAQDPGRLTLRPQLARRVAADAGSTSSPLLLCIGLHIEPLGATVSKLVADPALVPKRSPDPQPAGRLLLR